MKLKRFLLRYDPPGIGLEVEDDSGTLEVRHKDLPPAGQVVSEPAISKLVEDLCASEPELLSLRKHREALTQLMSKLYQKEDAAPVETQVGGGDQHSPRHGTRAQAEPPATKDPHPAGLVEGVHVVLVGLEGEQGSYNGQLGTLVKAKPSKDKYEVAIANSECPGNFETLKLREGPKHIIPVAPARKPLPVGTSVVLCRLRNHADLNGHMGRIVDHKEGGQRYEVRTLPSGQLFRVKFENVVPVEASYLLDFATKGAASSNSRAERPSAAGPSEFPSGALDSIELYEPGSMVEIVGLKSNMAFNGEQVRILSVDRERGRYEVRMNSGSIKKVRAENTRLVAKLPAAVSPNSMGAPPGQGAPLNRGSAAAQSVRHSGNSPEPTMKRKADLGGLRNSDWGSLSTEKLRRPDFSSEWSDVELRPGATVELTGVNSVPQLNGQRAIVVKASGDRVKVRLNDGSVTQVRRETVEPVAP